MTEDSPTVQTPDEAEALRRENEQLLTKLKYLQAEFENYSWRASCPSSTKWTRRSMRSKGKLAKGSGWSGTT